MLGSIAKGARRCCARARTAACSAPIRGCKFSSLPRINIPAGRMRRPVPPQASNATVRDVGSPRPGTNTTASSETSLTVPGSSAGSMLASVLSNAQRAGQFVEATIPRLESMNGRTFANALGVAALAGSWNDARTLELFNAACTPSLLRSKSFDSEDQCILYHVHVALSQNAPQAACLPKDIADACLRSHNTAALRRQGLYDVLALSLKRLGVPYMYRTVVPETGYLTWLLLPGPAPPTASTKSIGNTAGGHTPLGGRAGSTAHPLHTSEGAHTGVYKQYSLEVTAEWNCVPGSHDYSLAHRLYMNNLKQVAGVGCAHITWAEREAYLGSHSGRSIDIDSSNYHGSPDKHHSHKTSEHSGPHSHGRKQSPVSEFKRQMRQEQSREHDHSEQATPQPKHPLGRTHIPATRGLCRTLEELLAWISNNLRRGDISSAAL